MKKWLFVVLSSILFLSACNSGTSNSSYVPPVNTVGGYSYGSVSSGGSEYTCTTFKDAAVYYVVNYSYTISYTNVSPVAYIEAAGTLPVNWTTNGNCTAGTISANPSCTFNFSESSTSPITTPAVQLQFNGSAGVAVLGLSIPAATCP
jgi:hypothetical protein